MKANFYIFAAVLIMCSSGSIFASAEPAFAVCHISVVVDAKAEWTEKADLNCAQNGISDAQNGTNRVQSVKSFSAPCHEWLQNVLFHDKTGTDLVTNSSSIQVVEEEFSGKNGIEKTLTACWKI